jgi:serine/threonine-protein kinase
MSSPFSSDSSPLSPERWDRVLTLFYDALDRPPDDRDAFLHDACEGDEDLYHQVTVLLAADASDDPLLPTGGSWLTQLTAEQGSMQDEQIGPYHIQEEIGRGGMGVVYRAHRTDVEMTVAIKFLRERFPSAERLRRFLGEQRMLGRLEHRGIARLLDAGATDDGTPFFAMEHVDGAPITEYCDARGLDANDRLRLFLEVCDAVRYAHGNLVIHRDLKPSNVLVAETDDGPRVKLLDFGIAKLVAANADDASHTDERLLTPAYAAPEQVSDGPVSTATDVYALGALLYELLTGQRPLEVSGASLSIAIERILHDEPASPSEAAAQAEAPPIPPGRLRGDLDTICRIALRKKPDRRYASVEALRGDLQRFLDDLPIAARADGWTYRTTKFLRRHRTGVLATIGMVVLIGVLVTVYTLRLANERNRARTEAAKAAQVTTFVKGLFNATRPDNAATDTLRALTLLHRGEAQVDQLNSQPAVQAEMLIVIGDIYRRLGRYEDAETVLRRATAVHQQMDAPLRSDVLQAQRLLGLTLMDRSQFEQADSLLRTVVAAHRSAGDADPAARAASFQALGYVRYMQGQYAAAETLAHEALALRTRHLGPAHPDVARSQRALASALADQGAVEEAEDRYQQARAIMQTADHPPQILLAEVTQDYASLLNDIGRHREAEQLHREALRIRRTVLGSGHPEVALSHSQLALTLYRQEEYAAARDEAQKAVDIRLRAFGPQHMRTATALNQLSNAEAGLENYPRAIDLLGQSAGIYAHNYGPEHQFVGIVQANRATLLDRIGRHREALQLFRRARGILASTYGPDHWQTGYAEGKMTAPLAALGRYAEAERLLRHGYASLRAVKAPTGSMMQRVAQSGVHLYTRWQGHEAARAFVDSVAAHGVPRAPLDSLVRTYRSPVPTAKALP